MAFYESIAPWYSYIFPLSEKKVQFVKGLSLREYPKVTETGCATGEFALALTKSGCHVFGFDLDEEMIKICKESKDYLSLKGKATSDYLIKFRTLDMLEIADEPLAQDSDIACCFGNTLVHLNSLSQVQSYIDSVYRILTPGGTFTGQIVNYDRIIANKAKGLATIDNDFICFKREYSCENGTEYNSSVDCPEGILRINFKTELLVKKTGKRIENSIPLLALKKKVLEKTLTDAGFTGIRFYGNYNRDEWTVSSGPIIFAASR